MPAAVRQIIVNADADAVAQATATAIAESLHETLQQQALARIALAGGSTPKSIHRELVRQYRMALPWDRVLFFFGDERAVPSEDPECNARMARETLLVPLGIKPERVFPMDGSGADLSLAAARYEATLQSQFALIDRSRPPVFDLILLGLGTDAHTASLFPGTEALQQNERWVIANEVPQLATRRLTLTFPVLNAATEVVVAATGAAKAEALAAVFAETGDSTQTPARALAPPRLRWFIDAAAASGLTPEVLAQFA